MTLSTAGNLGIGTTAPTEGLAVQRSSKGVFMLCVFTIRVILQQKQINALAKK